MVSKEAVLFFYVVGPSVDFDVRSGKLSISKDQFVSLNKRIMTMIATGEERSRMWQQFAGVAMWRAEGSAQDLGLNVEDGDDNGNDDGNDGQDDDGPDKCPIEPSLSNYLAAPKRSQSHYTLGSQCKHVLNSGSISQQGRYELGKGININWMDEPGKTTNRWKLAVEVASKRQFANSASRTTRFRRRKDMWGVLSVLAVQVAKTADQPAHVDASMLSEDLSIISKAHLGVVFAASYNASTFKELIAQRDNAHLTGQILTGHTQRQMQLQYDLFRDMHLFARSTMYVQKVRAERKKMLNKIFPEGSAQAVVSSQGPAGQGIGCVPIQPYLDAWWRLPREGIALGVKRVVDHRYVQLPQLSREEVELLGTLYGEVDYTEKYRRVYDLPPEATARDVCEALGIEHACPFALARSRPERGFVMRLHPGLRNTVPALLTEYLIRPMYTFERHGHGFALELMDDSVLIQNYPKVFNKKNASVLIAK